MAEIIGFHRTNNTWHAVSDYDKLLNAEASDVMFTPDIDEVVQRLLLIHPDIEPNYGYICYEMHFVLISDEPRFLGDNRRTWASDSHIDRILDLARRHKQILCPASSYFHNRIMNEYGDEFYFDDDYLNYGPDEVKKRKKQAARNKIEKSFSIYDLRTCTFGIIQELKKDNNDDIAHYLDVLVHFKVNLNTSLIAKHFMATIDSITSVCGVKRILKTEAMKLALKRWKMHSDNATKKLLVEQEGNTHGKKVVEWFNKCAKVRAVTNV